MTKLDRLLWLFTKTKLTHVEVIEHQHLIIEIEEAMKLADEINEGQEDIKQGRVVSDEEVRKMVEEPKMTMLDLDYPISTESNNSNYNSPIFYHLVEKIPISRDQWI